MAGRDLAEPAELAEAEQAEQMAERETENEQPEAEGLELRPQATLEFPDRREERNRRGMIKFRLENGVPDVGGLGWRSRAGHLLKNQTFYASRPGENQWNNPTHAGPRTWRSYHGPKLRTDADLMERMDRIEAQHAQWEAKKAFVNTVRVQTLDRFYGRKIENEQKEMASQWAPHRRARGEYHKYHETMTSNLDSMPMKELKKVLTPTVLHGDREAIRSITKRIQTEETWKVAWKHMELARRAETQADFEHRMTYNAMLMELAGQAPRPHNPPKRPSSPCSPTLAGLAQPQQPKLITNITKRSDYRGLVHVDHAAALESRFPGCGHNLATTFSSDVSVKSKPAFPAPEPPATPVPQKMAVTTGNIRKGSVPVSHKRLHSVGRRQDSHGPPMLCSCGPHVLSLKDPSLLAEHSQHQFLPTSAPPACLPQQHNPLRFLGSLPVPLCESISYVDHRPDQGKMLLQEPNAVTPAPE